MKKPCPWGEKSECAAGENFFKERLGMCAPQEKIFQRKTRYGRAAGEKFFEERLGLSAPQAKIFQSMKILLGKTNRKNFIKENQ